MAIYIGSNRVKLNLNYIAHRVHLLTSKPESTIVRIKSSDERTLKDANGLYLTAKEYKKA